MEGFSEKDVSLFYKLLGHNNETEIRGLRENFPPIIKIVKNEEEFIEVTKKLNKERNVYAVLRERKKDLRGAARSEDIVALNIVVIDIDPIREKDRFSTFEELNNAIEVSKLISSFFIEKGFKKPISAISGNGAHLFFCLPIFEINAERRIEIQECLEIFENNLRNKFKHELEKYRCRIDRMSDLPRIGKVIGTKVYKKDLNDFRISYFLDEKVERYEDELLLKAILEKSFLSNEKFDKILYFKKEKEDECIKPVWLMQPIPYFGENLNLEGNWVVEPKIDGWRLEVIKTKEKVLFFGRRLEKNPDWTLPLSRIIKEDSLKDLPCDTILDCELYSDKGRRFIPSLFSKEPKVKPIIFVFDIIYLDGKFIGDLPLIERKNILKKIKFDEPFKLIEFKPLSDIKEDLERFLKEGHEGIVIKEINSKYIIGKNSPMATLYWRKIKRGRITIWQLEDSK